MNYQLKDLCSITKGATGIMKADGGKYPLVALSDERRSHSEFQFDAKAVIVPLISSTGHGHASMKRVHYQEGKFALGNILCAVIPNDEKQLNAKYLHLYLQQFKETLLVPLMKGAANVSLPMTKLADVEIEVPSLERQLEIIALEDEAAEYKNELEERLVTQDGDVAKLRQALMREAMEGKLTKQDAKDGNAKDLLMKLKAEIEKLISEKKLKKENELSPIKELDIPFEIPKNWAWCRLGDLGSFRRGPFGSALTKGIFVNEGYKVYEQRNAIYDNHTLGDYFVTKEKFQELKAFRVFPKDLIVSCSGATLGRIAEIPDDAREGIINQALMRITLFNSTILNSFFIKLFRSPYFQKNILGQAWGTAIPNMVGLTEIKKIQIPLPPLAEQKRIIERIEQLMKLCDELQYSIQQSKIENEKLLQGALRDALKKEEVEV